MAHFVKPPVDRVNISYLGEHRNNPVNIDLCTELSKQDIPNGYGVTYPVISFKGCDAQWYFNPKDAETRDKCYEYLLTNQSLG